MLVLSGIKSKPAEDGHIFHDPKLGIGLWFGDTDDLGNLASLSDMVARG